MNVTIENEIKIIRMGDKGPNLLSVDRVKKIIKELNYNECKAVIILGNEKVFSAGLNLKDLMSAKERKEVSLIFGTLGDLFTSCREFPGPVISIVGGHAIAGGCLLALASDYRYGIHGTHRMGLNEMYIGIDLPPDMLSIISHSISRDNLFEVATQCKMYTPSQAHKKGLINELKYYLKKHFHQNQYSSILQTFCCLLVQNHYPVIGPLLSCSKYPYTFLTMKNILH